MTETTAPVAPMYAAAGQGRRLRMWRPTGSGPNSASVNGIGTILNRSRDAQRNNAWAGAAVAKSVANGVGTGIQAKADWGTPEFRTEAKRIWDLHLEFCDADGVLDGYGLQALVWQEWKEAGEVFVRFRDRREEDGLPVPLQIQIIEAEQCPAEYYATAPNGNLIRSGVEFSKIGKRVAYWMYRTHPGDLNMGEFGSQLIRIPAEQIQHIYRPTRAGQIRGVPDASSVLPKLYNVDNMDDATLMRMQVANLFAGFLERDKQELGAEVGVLEENQTGTDTDGVAIAGLEPGTMQELPAGVKAVFSQPPEAGSSYDAFMRSQLLAIAARFGVPYEVLTGDLRNISDRALRLILNEFRRAIEMEQWLFLIPQMLKPWRRRFFDAAVLAGKLAVAGYADIRLDVARTIWVPQGWPYSHPVQDITADIKAIEAGIVSRDAVILSNGDDPEQVDAEIAAGRERAAAHGNHFGSSAQPAAAPAPTQDEPEEA